MRSIEQTSRVIDRNRAAIEQSTDVISRNATAISDSTAMIETNKLVIEGSTEAIQKNQTVVEQSTAAIQKNAEVLDRIGAVVERLKGNRAVLTLLIVVVAGLLVAPSLFAFFLWRQTSRLVKALQRQDRGFRENKQHRP